MKKLCEYEVKRTNRKVVARIQVQNLVFESLTSDLDRASIWDSRFVNILPKRSAKGSRKLVPNVLTVFLNFTFLDVLFGTFKIMISNYQ